jgi:hypothetical protein
MLKVYEGEALSRESPISSRKQFHVSRLLPAVVVMTFIAMIAAGESQVRSSPKWPPPSRHELGGWEIEDPAVLSWAAGLNLPLPSDSLDVVTQ